MEVSKKENIWNIPNFITFWRLIFTFSAVYFIFVSFNLKYVIIIFILGMLTDTVDGQVARRFKMTTEFGRKFDVFADRVLMLGIALPLVIKLTMIGDFTKFHLLQIALLLSREIISIPFVFVGIIKRRAFPPVRFIAKLTTVFQAFVFPMIVLSAYFKFFDFSIYFAILTCLVGIGSGWYYIGDVLNGKDQIIKPHHNKLIINNE
jgi:phosphatidylglycerophosphate synthase